MVMGHGSWVMGNRGHGRRRLVVTAVMTTVLFFFFFFFFIFFFVFLFFFFYFFFLADRGHGCPRSWATAIMGDAGYW